MRLVTTTSQLLDEGQHLKGELFAVGRWNEPPCGSTVGCRDHGFDIGELACFVCSEMQIGISEMERLLVSACAGIEDWVAES